MTMKIPAETSGWPTRDSALLMAEARPARSTGTEPMRVEVRGATTSEIPIPKSRTDGSGSTIAASGGPGGAGAAGQRPGTGREDDQCQAHRQADDRRPDRGVPQHPLKEQALDVEEDVERGVDQERREVDGAEGPAPEEPGRDERIAAPEHEDRERDEGRRPDAEGDDRLRLRPRDLLAPDRPEIGRTHL